MAPPPHVSAPDATPDEQAEISLVQRLSPLRDHPVLTRLEPLSKMADQPPMLWLSAAVLGFGLAARRPRAAEAGLRMLGSILLATAIKSAVKGAVKRTRPHVVLDEGRYRSDTGGSDDKGEQSFPSGHTADAVSAARAVVRVWPQAAFPAYGLAGAVAALQPARAKHYPSDVAAGAAIGALAEGLVDGAARAVIRASAR